MKTIVLDTNIWLSELALMSPLGCALSHYLNVSGFRLGLPEVIEIETKQNFKQDLYEYRENIKKNYDSTLAILAVSQGANCLKNYGGGKLEGVRKPERRNLTPR